MNYKNMIYAFLNVLRYNLKYWEKTEISDRFLFQIGFTSNVLFTRIFVTSQVQMFFAKNCTSRVFLIFVYRI